MRVLVACEFSGIVRDAFIAKGHAAMSCDLLPTERHTGEHLTMDASIPAYSGNYDFMVAHPPCDNLAVSGARWFPEKRADGRQRKAIEFFLDLWEAPIDRIAIENPIGIMSGKREYLKKWFPDLYERAKSLPTPQIIQPWQFGHGETKATCLWLKNLPKLKPTNIVSGREARVHKMGPSETRSMDRARTYHGIAAAMAEQWGKLEQPPSQQGGRG